MNSFKKLSKDYKEDLLYYMGNVRDKVENIGVSKPGFGEKVKITKLEILQNIIIAGIITYLIVIFINYGNIQLKELSNESRLIVLMTYIIIFVCVSLFNMENEKITNNELKEVDLTTEIYNKLQNIYEIYLDIDSVYKNDLKIHIKKGINKNYYDNGKNEKEDFYIKFYSEIKELQFIMNINNSHISNETKLKFKLLESELEKMTSSRLRH